MLLFFFCYHYNICMPHFIKIKVMKRRNKKLKKSKFKLKIIEIKIYKMQQFYLCVNVTVMEFFLLPVAKWISFADFLECFIVDSKEKLNILINFTECKSFVKREAISLNFFSLDLSLSKRNLQQKRKVPLKFLLNDKKQFHVFYNKLYCYLSKWKFFLFSVFCCQNTFHKVFPLSLSLHTKSHSFKDCQLKYCFPWHYLLYFLLFSMSFNLFASTF